MKKTIAYSVMALGLLGFFFFWLYEGSVIPLRALWFVLSFFVIVAGAYILATEKIKQFAATVPDTPIGADTYLRETGVKVKLTLDNCQVKSRSYRQEIVPDAWPSRMELVDGLANPEKNYKTEDVRQTYVVYECLFSGVPHKFISSPTSMDEVSARMLLDKRGGMLYIDKENPARYYFDLPF